MTKYAINFRPIGALHDCLIKPLKKDLMLYRSACLDKTPEVSRQIIRDLNIGCHIDLRMLDEISNENNLTDCNLEKIIYSINDPEDLIRNCKQYSYKTYGQSYINIIEKNIKTVVKMLKYITYSNHKRFVISCYAGKDRTGVISAILLAMLDMPEWLIHADYVMSTSYLLSNISAYKLNWEKRGISQDKYADRFKVDPRGISYMLGYYATEHGSLVTYMKSRGLNEIDITAFNKKFHTHRSVIV